MGTHRVLEVDTVVFCIGDKVEDDFGLPVQWNAFVKHPEPRFPVAGLSYEAYDPEKEQAVEGVFVAGWSREASSGLVGYARKDGEQGAEAVLQYLETLPAGESSTAVLQRAREAVAQLPHPVVDNQDVVRLAEIEQQKAAELGVEDFKFASNEEMLSALGKQSPAG
ncbi:MAG: hypothetical protein D6803_01745 [Anaerolineae bacterium]|nr:MAG: hypothetical protein D6803_01745 [Anaerolineae bacterium]